MRRTSFATLFAVLVAALLLLLGFAPGLAHASARPSASGPDQRDSIRPSDPGLAAASQTRPAAPPSLACLVLPRSTPCLPGADSPVVDLLSNASDSGARFSVGLALPTAGSNPASVLASFWVGLWVTGAPCSIDGASYLSVTLYPPYSPSVVPASPDWVAQVPVRDLAPSGSCDPLCQNASAAGAVGSVPVCEDNIVLGGGWASSPAVGRFAPGDQLAVTVWGSVGSVSPLRVWVNDTSNASASAGWSYGAASTVTGDAVGPRFDSSNASDGGWATPYDVAFGWTDCPTVPGPTSCNSYDGPALAATAVPLVTGASYWNSSTAAVESFPWIATASSSGACGGPQTLANCPDALTDGGTRAYPTLAIVPNGANASAWQIGSATGALATYGGVGQYNPTGAGTWQAPAEVTIDSASGVAGNATVNLTVADPRGASAVQVEALWCAAGGPRLAEVEVALTGTLARVTVPLNVASENGTLRYWVAERARGNVWGPSVAHALAMTGGTSSCAVPSPAAPGFSATNIASVAAGYHLTWTESSADVRGYLVTVNATTSGFSGTYSVGNVTATTVTGLPTPGSYRITVTAETFANTTAATTASAGTSPNSPLAVVASAVAGTFWHGAPPTPVNVTVRGGAAPYQVVLVLGNGSTTNVTAPTNSTTVPVALGGGIGLADVRVTVTDANGVAATGTPLLRDVWSGPLAPLANISAGGSLLGVNWTASSSPAGPVLRYAVFLTGNQSRAATPFRAGFSNTTQNLSDGGVEIWNTTALSLGLPFVDNVTAYATVVPEDAFGSGFATPVPLTATPAPLAPGPIEGGPGGPAPYDATFSTRIATGTNDTIDEAIYSFPGFAFTLANVTRTSPTEAYANTTARIATVGLIGVLLHVADVYGGTAIVRTSVLISAGAPPIVSASANPSPAYEGTLVNFTASATGTGPFVYHWQFGDGTNGSGASVGHSYGSAGTFTALVTVVDNGTGGSAIGSVPETVYAPPAVVIVTSAGPNGSDSLAFHARLIGGSGAGSYVWAFGDGAVAHGENVTHDYHATGTFVVNVTATDASLRTAYANTTVDIGGLSGTTSSGPSLGSFGPLSAGLLAAAVVGWAVAVIAVLRLRSVPEPSDDDDDD